MNTILEIPSDDLRFDNFPAPLRTPGHPPGDARLFLVCSSDGVPLARCAALWNAAMHLPDGETPGVIGWFAAREGAEAADAARTVLDAATAALRADHGAQCVVGPLDFCTWDAYRLALPEAGPRRFLPDVDTPPHYPALFESAGFGKLADYSSTRLVPTPETWTHLESASARFASCGVRMDTFDHAQAERELLDIFAVARVAFARAFLYTPISEEGFLARYRPYVPSIEPEFVLIARYASGAPAGFVFAIHNPLSPPDCPEIVVKTAAILPDAALRGLGTCLIEHIHRRAAEKGFKACYHALMHEANISAKITANCATVVRRYRLYERRS